MKPRVEDDIFGLEKANVLDIQLIIQNNKRDTAQRGKTIQVYIVKMEYTIENEFDLIHNQRNSI